MCIPAFHTFGPTGKLVVELSIIGFLLGTCIAFFVVIGDLGPDILVKALNIENSPSLRPSVLVGKNFSRSINNIELSKTFSCSLSCLCCFAIGPAEERGQSWICLHSQYPILPMPSNQGRKYLKLCRLRFTKFNLQVLSEALPHLLAADWLDHVNLWRPAGILQCIPIFSMALSCQT